MDGMEGREDKGMKEGKEREVKEEKERSKGREQGTQLDCALLPLPRR